MKKLDLGGVKTAAKTSRASHPQIEVDAETEALLRQFTIINPQFKTLKNQTETLAKQLAPRIKGAYFARFAGLTPESSTMLATVNGTTVKLIVKNAYTTKVEDEGALQAAIGAELVTRYFHQTTKLTLDLDKVPEEKQEAWASAVLALAKEMEVEGAISARQCIQPKAGFHEARTTILSAEQNAALDAVLPMTAYPML